MSDAMNFDKLLSQSEQADKGYCDIVVQSYASMFRAFCAQEDVTRAEALELTKTIMSARETVTAAILMQRRANGGGS
jgi:hypothetical protein